MKKKSISLFQEKLSSLNLKNHNLLSYQGTHVAINLNNLKSNLNYLKKNLEPSTKIMCVVKAFAYGSDPLTIGNFLEKNNVDYLAVAYTNEGVKLRSSGIKLPILILHPQIDDFDEILEYDLEPNIYSFRILERFLSISKTHPLHLKFNTGLNRLGFKIDDVDLLYNILGNGNNIKYLFSHLGASDDVKEKAFTIGQIELFELISKKMNTMFNKVFNKHLLNTSGILNYHNYQYDMVRTGIGLYGYGNDDEYNKKLKPVLTLNSIISQIHNVQKNESVGYNRGFIAEKDYKIGVIPIGHADGIGRVFGNGKIGFRINNQIAPTIGNICMDMLMVDITNIDCKEGDMVSIIDDKNQTAEEIGNISDTISYEILTALSSRMKRIIIEN